MSLQLHDRNPSQGSEFITLDVSELKKKSPQATVWIYDPLLFHDRTALILPELFPIWYIWSLK